MNRNNAFNGHKLRAARSGMSLLVVSALSVGLVSAAHAFEIESTGDLKMRWDNTLKYTAAWRTGNPDGVVANQSGNQPNTDAGDMAFKRGQINNRVDLLSEFDLAYKNFSFRVSGAAWYDAQYMKDTNDFSGPVPNSQASVLGAKNNLNIKAAQNIMGQRAEIADAFVAGKFDLGEQTLTLRAGRHSLVYGETLFLGMNGIANAQGPVDIVKALSLPNAQFKEIAMPVGQVSGNLALTPDVSVGAYIQYQWKENRIPAAGSYYSFADFAGAGADLLLHPFGCIPPSPGNSPLCGAPGYPFNGSTSLATRGADYKGSNSGNYGFQVKFKAGDVDYGLYAARYDDKTPIPVLNLTSIMAGAGNLGGGIYNIMYAKKVSTVGASFSTVFGETNVAGEISTRHNTPIATTDLIINSAVPNANNDNNTPYARGNSLHLNLSAISLFPGNSVWDSANLVAEFAYNRLLEVTHRPDYAAAAGAPNPLNTNHTKDASAIRLVFTPEYYQVKPGVDIQVPIGLGYGLSGRSAVTMISPEHGGDFSLGINATIDKVWKAGLSFTHYFGEKYTVGGDSTSALSTYPSYKQFYSDRDFISFTVQTTF